MGLGGRDCWREQGPGTGPFLPQQAAAEPPVPKFLAGPKAQGAINSGPGLHPQRRPAAFPSCPPSPPLPFQLPGRGCLQPRALRSVPASPPAAPLLAPGSPAAPPRPIAGPGPAAPLRGRAAPWRALSLPSLRSLPSPSPAGSGAEAERAFAQGAGGGRRAREGAPPGRRGAGRRCSRALAASEAIGSAQSPHAGLQRRPPRIGARAASTGACRSGYEEDHRLPGLGSPVRSGSPAISPAVQWLLHWGLPQPLAPQKGRERRAPRPSARPGRRPPRSLQHFALPPGHLHIPRSWPIRARLSRSGWLLPERKGSGWRRMRRGGRLEPRLLLL